MTLYRLDASIRVDGSASGELADIVEQEWLAAHPGDTIVRRHLATNPIPADAWPLVERVLERAAILPSTSRPGPTW